MSLLQELEKRRKELGMSRTALAHRSRVSLPTINRILSSDIAKNGRMRRGYQPSLANVEAIAGALGLTLAAPEILKVDELRHQEATLKAKRMVRIVQGTSALEGQCLDQREADQLVSKAANQILKSNGKLWF